MRARSHAASESCPAESIDPLLRPAGGHIRRENARLRLRVAEYRQQIRWERQRADALLDVVIPAAIQLSVEKDFHRLLERILLGAKALCNADGGTLYLRSADSLQFMLMHTTSLNVALGRATGTAIPYAPLHLYDEATGEPNQRHIATYVALYGSTISIPDAYQAEGFDFAGTRAFDRLTGYRSTSFLTVPLKRGAQRVIGALQLINALDHDTGQVIPFGPDLHSIVEALASLAAVALESYIRERGLREQIQRLHVEIDEAKKVRQVAEITETDHFRRLQQRARALRRRVSAAPPAQVGSGPCPVT